jgi:hypothetical protein
MKPKQVTVTSGNSPLTVPVDAASASAGGVIANPNSATYTVEATLDNIFDDSITPTWQAVTDMDSATSQVESGFSAGVTALKITLDSGTSVAVSINHPSTGL